MEITAGAWFWRWMRRGPREDLPSRNARHACECKNDQQQGTHPLRSQLAEGLDDVVAIDRAMVFMRGMMISIKTGKHPGVIAQSFTRVRMFLEDMQV
jgi:hypothetical protein